MTSGYFDKDGTINGDSINHKMLKALFTEYIPSESVADDTIENQNANEKHFSDSYKKRKLEAYNEEKSDFESDKKSLLSLINTGNANFNIYWALNKFDLLNKFDEKTQQFLKNLTNTIFENGEPKTTSFYLSNFVEKNKKFSQKENVKKELKSVYNTILNNKDKIIKQEFPTIDNFDYVGTIYSDDILNQEDIDNILDLSDKFENVQSNNPDDIALEVEKTLNALINFPMDTATPPLQIQITKENKPHIIKTNLVLDKKQTTKHQTALTNLEQITNNAVKLNRDGTVNLSHNTRKSTIEHKKKVKQYIYFGSPVKLGNNLYIVELHTEQVKEGQPENLLNLYNVRVKYQGTASNDTLSPDLQSILKNKNQDVKKNQLFQGRKGNGFFDSRLKAIIIGSNYNSGTLPHEFAHFFLDKNFELYKSGKGTDAFNKEMKALFEILGVNENQTFLEDLESKQTIRLGKLPSVYQNLDWENAEVKTNKSVILKDTEIKHNVPMNVVKQLPELYSDPLLVFESATHQNRLVAVIDAKDNSGRQIVVALSPDTKKTNGYHFIPSFYGKDNFEKFVEENVKAGRLRYIKNNQVSDSLQLRSQALDYMHNIKHKSDIVNPQIKSVDNRGTFSSDTGNIYLQGRKGNGFFDSRLKAIIIGSNYNSGTLPHEFAHFFLDKNFELYKSGKGRIL